MKMKSIIMQCNVYLRYFRIDSTEKRKKKKIILALTVHSVRQRRRDCELIENLHTYLTNTQSYQIEPVNEL